MALDANAVTDGLYSAFEHHAAPRKIECSPYKSREDVRTYADLVTFPLREAPAEVIGPYAGSAIYTVGSESDYRHFLPRILEIALHDHGWLGFEPWSIAHKLIYAGWEKWTPAEIEALRCYFVFGLESAAKQHPNQGCEFDSWLVATLTLGEPAEAVLKLSLLQNSSNTTCNLAYMVITHQKELIKNGNLGSDIWEYVPAPEQQSVLQFLASDQFTELLIVHGAQASEDDTFAYFSPALAIIEQLRADQR